MEGECARRSALHQRKKAMTLHGSLALVSGRCAFLSLKVEGKEGEYERGQISSEQSSVLSAYKLQCSAAVHTETHFYQEEFCVGQQCCIGL